MRIPSQFNDRSLYPTKESRSGGNTAPRREYRTRASAGKNDAYRRIFRLGIALVLVLVVMQQAAKPRVYQTFFGGGKDEWKSTEPGRKAAAQDGEKVLVALTAQSTNSKDAGAPPENKESDQANPSSVASDEAASTGNGIEITTIEVPVDDPNHAKLSDQLVAKIPIAQQRLWMLQLAQWQHQFQNVGRPRIATSGSDVEPQNVEDQIDGLSDFDEALRAKWKVALTEIHDSDFDARATPQPSAVVYSSFLKALDRAAMERVVDGTNWRSADSDAFYLQLDQADYLQSQGATVVGTLPLLQQPDAYRGELVQVIGTIGLAEKAKAKSNGFGITDYWKLWVIPGDGGNRPIVLITRSLPNSIADGFDESGKWKRDSKSGDTAEITAVGRFVKRLPYRSSIGADSAPVVIGRVIAQKTFAPPTPDPNQTVANAQNWKLWGMLGGAVLAGLVLAIWLTQRANQAAEQSRRLRANHQSHESMDFSVLADQPSEAQRDLDDSLGSAVRED